MAKKEVTKQAAVSKSVAKEIKAGDNREYRLKTHYQTVVVPQMVAKFGYKNLHQVPRIEKIVLNRGLGYCQEMEQISGQKAVITKATKSVANFKVREGMNVGAKVTLRSARMYDFLDKLISIVLPRVRDFKGVSTKSFDGRGNYAMGVKEQLIFPEISYDQVEKTRGMDICIVTTAKTDEEAKELLALMGVPFARN